MAVLTWGLSESHGGSTIGIGVNPVVQPNGTVVVGFADFNGGMSAFMSTNGGQSWNAAISISSAPSHGEGGGLRSAGLPSTAIDGAGQVYVSWPDCRFESGCTANDIVYSSSSDGIHWSAVVRVPIDPIGSGVDHFIHGMGIDTKTSGSSAHMAITYYYYPVSDCGGSCPLVCRPHSVQRWRTNLDRRPAAFGRHAVKLATQHFLRQNGGRLCRNGVPGRRYDCTRAFPIFALALTPTGSLFPRAIYTEGYGFSADEMTEQRMSSENDKPIPGAKSDHPARRPEDRDNELPVSAPRPISPAK